MGKKEAPNSYTVFIPGNLDLKAIVEIKPPDFKYKLDEGFYLIDLIGKQTNKKANDTENTDSYARLHSVLMQSKVKDYRKWLDYFISQEILTVHKQYIVGEKSKGYKFRSKYQCSEIKAIKITDKFLIKKIVKFHEIHSKKNILSSENEDLAYLYKWLEDGKLKIDYNAAKKHLEKLKFKDSNSDVEAERLKKKSKSYKSLSKKPDFHFKRFQREIAYQKYNSRLRPLILFHKGTFNARTDKTAGRLHSVLTQLKSDLRQFITYDGQFLVSVDIVSSQPYLSTIFLNFEKYKEYNIANIISLYNPNFNTKPEIPIMLAKKIKSVENEKDVLDYINAVKSGNIYEQFAVMLNIEDRAKAKEAFFKTLFNPNELGPHIEGIKIFKKKFPNVFEIFSLIKSSKSNHRALACTLQNFEAKLILHTACKRINKINPNIPMFTLHDSIITIPKYTIIVEKVMTYILKEATSIIPSLRIERWERVA